MTQRQLTVAERAALARASAAAAPHATVVSPNPAVGCVVLRDGEPVGHGVTEPPPGAHAEVVALRAAGGAARGATAVVTLEPCAHHGRTPPCTDALVDAGVARVVFAHPDPNPVATGGGARLAQAGVDVVGPLPAQDPYRGAVAAGLEGFLTVVRHGRPHVTLKLARTADGAVTNPTGERWVTGPLARRAVHRWRGAVDGVLVGIGTVLADDPRLDVREVPVGRQPRAVIIDTDVRTPVGAKVVRAGTVLLAATPSGAGSRERRRARAAVLSQRGVEVRFVSPGPEGRGVDLPGAVGELAGLGMVSLLAEPGPTLADALLGADLVDRLVLHVAVGLGDGPLQGSLAPPPGTPWRTERSGGAGTDAIVHLRPPPPPR